MKTLANKPFYRDSQAIEFFYDVEEYTSHYALWITAKAFSKEEIEIKIFSGENCQENITEIIYAVSLPIFEAIQEMAQEKAVKLFDEVA